jgi:hypothetical protein
VTGYSVMIQFSSVVSNGFNMLFGAETSGKRIYLSSWTYDNTNVWYCCRNNVFVAPKLASGNLAIAGNSAYRNGISDSSALTGVGLNTHIAYIGCINLEGTPSWFLRGNIAAIVVYNVTLTAPQVLARATAMAAL